MQWLTPNQSLFYFGGKPAVEFFNNQITKRRDEIPVTQTDTHLEKVTELKSRGFTKWTQMLDHSVLDSINDKVSYYISKNTNLKSIDEHYAMIADPLINVPEILEIAFSDHILDFAEQYFECYPALGTFNLRRTFLNNLPPKSTQFFHCDRNSIKFFKFFIYLNDVQSAEDGPLTIVEGSNLKRPVNCFNQHRWQDNEIHNIYGKENFRYLTASKGDLIAGTTTCFHKGNKPTSKERTMLTLNYVVHPELAGGRPGEYEKFFKIKQEQYDSLTFRKKRAADFLEKI